MDFIPTARDVIASYLGGPEYKANSVAIGDKAYTAADISGEDIEILAQELDTIIDREQNPTLAAIIARGSPRILDCVRMVNANTKQGYKGAAARGMQLLAQPLAVADLYISAAATARTTWLVTITAVAAAQWSGDSTNTNDMLESSLPVISHVVLGFVDPVEVPKIDKIQLIKNGDPWCYEVLTFNWRATFGDHRTPTYELKQPWMIPPGEKYYIACNRYLTGDDKLQPIGFVIKRATDIIAALA